jgi:hypothetical protein
VARYFTPKKLNLLQLKLQKKENSHNDCSKPFHEQPGAAYRHRQTVTESSLKSAGAVLIH